MPADADALRDTGMLLKSLEKYADARRYLEKAMKIKERELGGLGNLEVENLAEQIGLCILEGTFGDSPGTFAEGETQDGVKLQQLQAAHDVMYPVYKACQGRSASAPLFLAGCLSYMGKDRFLEAAVYYAEAMALTAGLLGMEHEQTRFPMYQLAYMLREDPNLSPIAEMLQLRIARFREDTLGFNNHETLTAYAVLAKTMRLNNKIKESFRLYTRVLKAADKMRMTSFEHVREAVQELQQERDGRKPPRPARAQATQPLTKEEMRAVTGGTAEDIARIIRARVPSTGLADALEPACVKHIIKLPLQSDKGIMCMSLTVTPAGAGEGGSAEQAGGAQQPGGVQEAGAEAVGGDQAGQEGGSSSASGSGGSGSGSGSDSGSGSGSDDGDANDSALACWKSMLGGLGAGVELVKQGAVGALPAPPAEAGSESQVLRTCLWCGVVAPCMQQCSRCRAVFLCSTECRDSAWPTHKAECKRLAAERGK